MELDGLISLDKRQKKQNGSFHFHPSSLTIFQFIKITRTASARVTKETVTSVVKYQINAAAMDTKVKFTRVVIKRYGTEKCVNSTGNV